MCAVCCGVYVCCAVLCMLWALRAVGGGGGGEGEGEAKKRNNPTASGGKTHIHIYIYTHILQTHIIVTS